MITCTYSHRKDIIVHTKLHIAKWIYQVTARQKKLHWEKKQYQQQPQQRTHGNSNGSEREENRNQNGIHSHTPRARESRRECSNATKIREKPNWKQKKICTYLRIASDEWMQVKRKKKHKMNTYEVADYIFKIKVGKHTKTKNETKKASTSLYFLIAVRCIVTMQPYSPI